MYISSKLKNLVLEPGSVLDEGVHGAGGHDDSEESSNPGFFNLVKNDNLRLHEVPRVLEDKKHDERLNVTTVRVQSLSSSSNKSLKIRSPLMTLELCLNFENFVEGFPSNLKKKTTDCIKGSWTQDSHF